jgi:trehalose 6-phosphate phosphatase
MIPSALDHVQEIAGRCDPVAIFLDFDGTLTPIVDHPQKAFLSDSMRQTVQTLATHAPVAILSGRDLKDIRRRVDIDTIIYGGSHGFDIARPGGLRNEVATEFLPELDIIEKEFEHELAGISGTLVERKRFSVAAHYRNVNESDVPRVKRAVSEVAARHNGLRRIEGKKVYELVPAVDWDKGKAVLWLLKTLGVKHKPIYIGDDRTDEDAFRTLEQSGIGILVADRPRPTAASYSLRNPTEVERFLRELITRMPVAEF